MMKIEIVETPRHFEIRFQYHPALVAEVKRIPMAGYRHSERMWTVPLNQRQYVDRLRIRFGLNKVDSRPEDFDVIPELPELTADIPLKKELFPFQRTGVAYALQKQRLIVGDQPGLGKTAQAIATLVAAGAWPCLVICPSSLKMNWQREIEMWTGMRNTIIMSDKVKRTWKEYLRVGAAKVMIVNYESLKKYFVAKINKKEDEPLRLNHIEFDAGINLFKSLIIDESHRVKEGKTAQTKYVKGIAKGKEWILALTGTPVVNKPRDLASQLSIIDQLQNFGGYKVFMDRYCEGYNGASNLRELNYKLNMHCFYRREKKDVLKELPDKMRQIVLCEITNRPEYNVALADLETYLRRFKQATDEKVASSLRGEVMVRIQILKDISARGKLKDIAEQVQEVMDQGEKLVLFTHLRTVGDELLKAFPGAISIRGGDTIEDRQRSVDRFQNDPNCQLIICSMKAAGVGLTLTAASRVAFCELPWHAADCDQCEDRCHRIGQHDSVQCTYYLGKDTIDEYIYQLIDKKRDIANTITGANESIQTEVMDIMASSLFNKTNFKDALV